MKTQMENLIPGNFVSARERAVLMGKSGTPPHTHTQNQMYQPRTARGRGEKHLC